MKSETEDSIPEGEMSMDEIMRNYPYLVHKLREGVPGLNEPQMRKAINVFFSLCSSCHNSEIGCQCWNDN